MPNNPYFKIFLTHNFDNTADFIRNSADRLAKKMDLKIVTTTPGTTAKNPAEEIREQLEEVEGLLAILDTDTSWTSNEIGMAYALRLPIFVITKDEKKVSGISRLVTSIMQTEIHKQKQLNQAMQEGFNILIKEMINLRKNWPEPPPNSFPVHRFNWNQYYKLVNEAHKVINLDVNNLQGGFKPTFLLGISRGGIIVADLLSRKNQDLPLGFIEANRTAQGSKVFYSEEPIRTILIQHLEKLRNHPLPQREPRILIIDDALKSGKSLYGAVKKVCSILSSLHKKGEPKAIVKSLVLIQQGENPCFIPDYRFKIINQNESIILPYGLG